MFTNSRLVAFCMALMLLAGVVERAAGAPLNLTPVAPDVNSAFVDVSYTLDPAGPTGTFTANGWLISLTPDGFTNYDVDGGAMTSNITATIDEATGTLIGGTITLLGEVSALGYVSGTLLTGTLTAFGFERAEDINGFDDPTGFDTFEFVFKVTGGDASAIWPGSGGAVVNAVTGFTGVFTSPFSTANVNSSAQDTFSIPGPGILAGFALLGFAGYVSRRRLV